MANKTIPMEKIRDIIRLNCEGYSFRKISKLTGVHRKVVTAYISHFKQSSISFPDLLLLSDSEFSALLLKEDRPAPRTDKQLCFFQFLEYAQAELGKRHVTRQLLYQEYKNKFDSAFSYSHFCQLLSEANKARKLSLPQLYSPGEIMLADFAGDKLHYFDSATGEKLFCEVLVVTLGYSGYSFVIALPDQTQESLVDGINRSVVFFKGSSKILKFDNLKAGVIKADRYEPTFNQLISNLCQHYKIVPDAARAGKPKDKAQVESHVNIVYQRIYAPLRNHSYTSLKELNQAIVNLLEVHNHRPFRGSSKSRWDYYQEEAAVLTPLPDSLFERKYCKKAAVQQNYHIWLGHDEHYYSVPFKYAGRQVTAVYDTDTVEIFFEYTRIAIHPRKHKIGRYSTLRDHMPPEHIAVVNGMNPEWLKTQAASIGPNTALMIEKILTRGLLTPQHFKSCQGVLSLARRFSSERLEKACSRSLLHQNYSYKAVENILQRNLDSVPEEVSQTYIVFNPDTRGSQNYH